MRHAAAETIVARRARLKHVDSHQSYVGPGLNGVLAVRLGEAADSGVGHEAVGAVIAAAEASIIADAESWEQESVHRQIDGLGQAEIGWRETYTLIAVHIERAGDAKTPAQNRSRIQRIGVIHHAAMNVILLIDAAFRDGDVRGKERRSPVVVQPG